MSKLNIKNSHILVTPTSFGKNDETLKSFLENQVGRVTYNTKGRPLTTVELGELIQDVDGLIAGLDLIDANIINVAKNLKVISRYGVGVDNLDLEAARNKGITVTNTPGANSSSVAELTVGLILMVARNMMPAVIATRSGEWPRLSGSSLEDKVIGLIGFGNIGQQVARRLYGFGCKIIAYDVFQNIEIAQKYGVVFKTKEELFASSDFISLHCNLYEETLNIINQDSISMMKRGVSIINTARGDLIDEKELLFALNDNKIANVALDVFSIQPPNPKNPLLSHPKAIVTPHMGAHSDAAIKNMGWGATKNCLAVLQGEEPINKVV